MGAHGSTNGAKLKGFAAFWAAYPRKVGKRKAESAYTAAIGRAGGDDPGGTILAGLDRAKRSRDWRREPEFIPHPTTWLNRDGWEDELDGVSPTPQSTGPPTPELQAQHVRHFRDTGEWRDSWGPRPPPEVGQPATPFPPARTAA